MKKSIVKMIIRIILRRASEASTWRGIILAIGGVYTINNPELVEAIIPICVALVGLIGAMLPDNPSQRIAHAGDPEYNSKGERIVDRRSTSEYPVNSEGEHIVDRRGGYPRDDDDSFGGFQNR